MQLTTREFIGLGGVALAGAALPTWAGKSKATPCAAPKVRLAAIGTGGRGHTDLHNFLRSGLAEITCAADVYAPALDWVRKEQPKAKLYADYRKMLAECAGRYDAVSIMTPDHTHCVAFLEASKYNVPVYCAKPLAHTIDETLAMMRVAREKKIITQVSHHGNSEPGTPLLREWMESGIFGQAVEAHVYCNYGKHLFREPHALLSEPAEPPKGFDWELWQGPVKRRPYIKNVYSKRWRSWTMYGEGCVGDWCCHLMGPLAYALDLDLPCAVTLADFPGFNLNETPCSFPFAPHYVFEYPAKGKRAAFTLHWYDGDARPPRPLGLEPDQAFDPVADEIAGGWMRCEKETLVFGQTGASSLRVVPHSHMKAVKPHLPPKKYPRYKNHWAEFLQAVQQKRPANTPFELGGKFTLMGFMGTIATRFPGRRLTFDPVTARCTNCPEANALMRPDWTGAALAEYGAFL